MEKINQVISYVLGIWAASIGVRMFYYHVLFWNGKTILPYAWFNPFVDWIPLISLGILVLFRNYSGVREWILSFRRKKKL